MVNNKLRLFASRFKEIFNNVTNKEIAKSLKLSEPAISSYLKGRVPPAEKLIEISKLTGCNIHWLLTGEGEKMVDREFGKPETLIFQGCKGGIGNSTAAAMTAFVLARRGSRVLFVDDGMGDGARLALPNTDKVLKNELQESFLTKENFYFQSWIGTLDVFVPKNSHWKERLEHKLKPFNKNVATISRDYDYLIIDGNSHINPFVSDDSDRNMLMSVSKTIFDSFLTRSKVVVPYQPYNSRRDSVESVLKNIAIGQKIYPETELLGIFLNNLDERIIRESIYFESLIVEIEVFAGEKMMKSKIHMHSDDMNIFRTKSDKSFEKNLKIVKEFEILVDEIKDRLCS